MVMGVQVSPEGDHLERSELQLRKGDQSWGGSRERNRGPMNKNRIGGDAESEASGPVATKPRWSRRRLRRSGGRAGKDDVLTWGDLALCPKGRRRESDGARSQQRPDTYTESSSIAHALHQLATMTASLRVM